VSKKIFILFFYYSLFICNYSYGQWVRCGILGGDVYSLASSGNNIYAGTSLKGVWRSTNNGLNWQQTELNYGTVFAITTLGNNVFAGTYSYNYDCGVFISTNNGINWSLTSLNNITVTSLISLGNIIFAGTGNGVYSTTNYGTNWAQTSLNNVSVSTFTLQGNVIYAGTVNGVYRSSNNGLNWILTALNFSNVQSLTVCGNNVFAGTFSIGGGVYLSTNNGNNWSLTTLINQDIFSLASSGNNVFAGTGYNGVYLSTNNGTNWIEKNQGTNYTFNTVLSLLTTNNYIFAGTYDSSVWKRDISEIIEVKNISSETPNSFSLFQNYPNPFNPSTNIKYQITNNKLVILKVFDILGKEIATLVNEKQLPGTYEVQFPNVQSANVQLSSGVYFYKLSTGDFSEVKKMLFIK
jgi:hypothetical protein